MVLSGDHFNSRFLHIGLLLVRGAYFEGAGELFAINGKDELYAPELAFLDLEAAEVIALVVHFAVQIVPGVVADGEVAFGRRKRLHGKYEKITLRTVECYFHNGCNGIRNGCHGLLLRCSKAIGYK